jgi:hypothetical protein
LYVFWWQQVTEKLFLYLPLTAMLLVAHTTQVCLPAEKRREGGGRGSTGSFGSFGRCPPFTQARYNIIIIHVVGVHSKTWQQPSNAAAADFQDFCSEKK